jgi:hydrogenase expression/formation protein HypD
MVASEGACAAYYNFGRLHREAAVRVGSRAPVASGAAVPEPA